MKEFAWIYWVLYGLDWLCLFELRWLCLEYFLKNCFLAMSPSHFCHCDKIIALVIPVVHVFITGMTLMIFPVLQVHATRRP